MPWKETTTMEQKIEFICEWRTGKYTITELCKSFEISRPTAYKLISRFEKQGFEGLKVNSRAPSNHPNATKENIIRCNEWTLSSKTHYIKHCNDFVASEGSIRAYMHENEILERLVWRWIKEKSFLSTFPNVSLTERRD